MTENDRQVYQEYKRKYEAYRENKFASRNGLINWSGPNLWTGILFTLLFVASYLPIKPTYFCGLLSHPQTLSLGTLFFTYFFRRTLVSYQLAISGFIPATATEAKRANEQIKLTAVLINSSAVAAAGVVALKEVFETGEPHFTRLVLALMFAGWIHIHARALIGLLKDENPMPLA